MMNKDILVKLKNPLVRDMYWLLSSSSPIGEGKLADLPLFPEAWLDEIVAEHESFFYAIDESPQSLIAFVSNIKSTRMGVYAETLLTYFFERSPFIELKLSNFQLIVEKQTIGEVDFIISWRGKLISIELAVKYYLARISTSVLSEWIGSAGNDNLSKKINKVIHHQLGVVKNDDFISQTRLNPNHSFFLLKGRFYTHNAYQPNWKNSTAIFGKYYFWSEIKNELAKNNKSYLILKRPAWLASIDCLDSDSTETIPSITSKIKDLMEKYKSLHFVEKNTKKTFFVVQDDWPTLRKLDAHQ